MWTSLIGPVTGLISEFIEDKDKANELAHKIDTMAEENAHELAKAQVEVNKAEAGHRSIFVAGWRPFIGWVCGIALAWHFVGVPVVNFVVAYLGLAVPALPSFDMDSLMTVLLGMLGLGGLRTYEKKQGITK